MGASVGEALFEVAQGFEGRGADAAGQNVAFQDGGGNGSALQGSNHLAERGNTSPIAPDSVPPGEKPAEGGMVGWFDFRPQRREAPPLEAP